MDTARVRLLYSSLRGSLKLAQALLEIVQEMGLSVASVSKTNWIVFSFGTAILPFMGGLGVFFGGCAGVGWSTIDVATRSCFSVFVEGRIAWLRPLRYRT